MHGNPSKLRILSIVLLCGLIASCKQVTIEQEFSSWTMVPLPKSATNLHVERPSFFRRLLNNSFYACFELTGKEMILFLKTPLEGYTAWEPLGEVYSNKHFFTSSQYPGALQSYRKAGESISYMIVEPEKGVVHALAWRN